MASASILGTIKGLMKEIGRRTRWKEKGSRRGLMEEDMKADIKIISFMGMDHKNGQIRDNTMASIETVNKKAKVFINGLMDVNTTASGAKTNLMAREITQMNKLLSKLEPGSTESVKEVGQGNIG